MMDIEKLIDTLKRHGVSCVRSSGRYCSICDEAATALSALQDENEKLRAELKRKVDLVFQQAKELDRRNLLLQEQEAELEQVKRERDAAVEEIRGDCEKCAHYRATWNGCTPDFECPLSDQCLNRDIWQWRGPQKED